MPKRVLAPKHGLRFMSRQSSPPFTFSEKTKAWTLCLTGFMDHYDSALYGFLGVVFADTFFHTSSATTSLILTYMVWGMGLLFRPLGGFMATYFAETNRIPLAFTLSFSLITFSMVGFAVLPDRQSIGLFAPLLIIVLRGILDFATSLERTLAKPLLLMNLKHAEAIKWSSYYDMCSLKGLFSASLAPLVLAHFPFLSWRVFFFCGALLSSLVFVLRRYMLFSANSFGVMHSFHASHTEKTLALSSFKRLLKEPQTFITLTLAFSFSYVTYTLPFVFLGLFIPLLKNASALSLAFQHTPFLWLFDFLCLFFVGFLGKKTTAIQLMKIGLMGFLLGLPVFFFIPYLNTTLLFIWLLWLIGSGVFFAVPLTPWALTHLSFHAIPFTSIALSQTLGSGLVRGNLTALLLALYQKTGYFWAPFIPLALLALATFCTLFKAPHIKKPELS